MARLKIYNGSTWDYVSAPDTTTVTTTGTQTLTNKTIVAGSNTISGIANANLSTTAGDIGGAWSSSTCTLTVSGGTVPTYTTNSWRTTVIGKTIIATLTLANSSGGTAGAGANPLFVSLPYATYSGTRIGHGSIYNGGTAIIGTQVIKNFEVVSSASGTTAYLAIDDVNASGANQSNANRYIYLTVTYETT